MIARCIVFVLVLAISASAAAETCIAPSLPALTLVPSVRSCSQELPDCEKDCAAGDAESCLGVAYVLKRDDRAPSYYRRACELGLANACTNYAAFIWSSPHTDEQLACAVAIFKQACRAGEAFGCGMVGRILFMEAEKPADYEAAREHLEAACTAVSGFPCRVLAKQLETEKLGSYPPGRIVELLKRACDGGDPDACGDPSTAAETFD